MELLPTTASALCFGMGRKVKDFNIPLPYGLAVKRFYSVTTTVWLMAGAVAGQFTFFPLARLAVT